MKAFRLYGPRDLRLEDVPLPEIGPYEVRIRIEACGICPSDLAVYASSRIGKEMEPFIPGHEWVGEVQEVGSAVTGFRIGDRVAPYGQVVCGMCENCQRGIPNKCLAPQWILEGGFSEYGRASAQGLLHLPEGLSYEVAAFTEPVACCLNGIWRSRIQLGDDVAVVGAGPIGLLHVQLARLQGARVITTDCISSRLEVAKEVGAHEAVDASKGDVVDQVRALTKGRGADVVIVATGDLAGMEQALQMAGLHGTVNLFAASPGGPHLAVDPHLLHSQELLLTGSHHFSPFAFQRALKLLQYGLMQVKPLISHRLPLEGTREGCDIVGGRHGLKVIILPQYKSSPKTLVQST